jgi:hypothetical protein
VSLGPTGICLPPSVPAIKLDVQSPTLAVQREKGSPEEGVQQGLVSRRCTQREEQGLGIPGEGKKKKRKKKKKFLTSVLCMYEGSTLVAVKHKQSGGDGGGAHKVQERRGEGK